MRNVLLAGVLAAAGLAWSGHAVASEGFDDLAKLAKSGVNDDVMLAYIDASPVAYELTVDEILFFNDLGLSPKVVAAAVKHGKELRAANPPAPAVADDPPAPQPALAPPPAARPVVDRNPAPQNDGQGDVELSNDPVPIRSAPVTTISQAPEEVYSTTTVVAPPEGQATISTFYDALSPYGTWINLDGSYVWQPNAINVDRDWRPYCQRGHWVYTDVGWAWQSDYSWGWAPFHYGRWARHDRYGWIWSPDTTWGPAWVSWRNDGRHAGWAPLPPRTRVEAGVGLHFGNKHVSVDLDFGITERDYTFVPVEHVCETTLTSYYVPRDQVTIVYNQTSYVRDNYRYENDRVFNRGISVEIVAERSHREIRPITVVDVNVQVGQPIRGTAVTGASFAVYRPAIRNEVPESPEVIAARREEQAKRVALRQQAATERTAIRQQNSVDRTAARQEAATAEAQARKDAEVRRAQAAAEARAQAAENRAQTKEQRDAEIAAREQARQAAETRAKEDRLKAAEAKRQQNQENAAARQADEAAKDQARRDAALKAQAERQQNAAKADADQAAREQARRDALARAQAERQENAAERKADQAAREQARRDADAKADADQAAREQARRDALAKAQAERQENAAERKADQAAREQARRDADAKADAERAAAAEARRAAEAQKAQARAADQAAREQARRDAAAKEAAEAQARRDARAAKNVSDGQPDPNNPNDPDNPKPNKKKKKGGDDN